MHNVFLVCCAFCPFHDWPADAGRCAKRSDHCHGNNIGSFVFYVWLSYEPSGGFSVRSRRKKRGSLLIFGQAWYGTECLFRLPGSGFSWQRSCYVLTAVFIEGFIFLFLSLIGMRQWLVALIPSSLKIASTAGIGLFLTLIGLSTSAGLGVITGAQSTPLDLAGCPLQYQDDFGVCQSHKLQSPKVSPSLSVVRYMLRKGSRSGSVFFMEGSLPHC